MDAVQVKQQSQRVVSVDRRQTLEEFALNGQAMAAGKRVGNIFQQFHALLNRDQLKAPKTLADKTCSLDETSDLDRQRLGRSGEHRSLTTLLLQCTELICGHRLNVRARGELLLKVQCVKSNQTGKG